jgi:hypothetical protein
MAECSEREEVLPERYKRICEEHRKECLKEIAPTKANKPEVPQSRGKVLFQGQLSPKKLKKIKTLEQWVEISVEDGKTVTRLYPSNEQLIKDGQKMWPPPDLIYRRLNFVNGIPEEYRWAVRPGDEARMQRGGCGIQRMEVDTWLHVIEREKLREDGHIGPTGVGNLPRPMERGGCECPMCKRNREILEKRAEASS